jgi:hypothetical protein
MRAVEGKQARPAMGADAQAIINPQVVDESDAVIAIFKARLGTKTPRSDSGTAEEIERVAATSKDVMVYFSTGTVALKGLDPKQLARLQAFQKSLERQGLIGYYSSDPELRNQLEDHIAGLGDDFQQRILSDVADEVGRTPVLGPNRNQGLGRDMARKACLTIAGLGPVMGIHSFIGIGLDLRNEGDYPAYDVKVMRDLGEGFEPEWGEAAIAEIPPRETRSTDFRVPPPQRDETNTWYSQERTVRLRITFRDGLAQRDEAIFTIKMVNQQSMWNPKEDKQAAQFSTYCAHLRPQPPPDRRPRGLSEEANRLIETLVRRAAVKSEAFYPTILSRPCGDDMYCYQSEPINVGKVLPDEKQEMKLDRNVLPALIRDGYIAQESKDQYRMLDPLLRAYGPRRRDDAA